MSESATIKLKLYSGPNLVVPYPALIAEIKQSDFSVLPGSSIDEVLGAVLAPELRNKIETPAGDYRVEDVAVLLLRAMQDLPAEVLRDPADSTRIATRYFESTASSLAVGMALEVAGAIINHLAGYPANLDKAAQNLRQLTNELHSRQPDYVTRALMRVAQSRNIPVYPIGPGSRIWRYGQGCRGWLYFETASQLDSMIGGRLAGNKLWSNRLVKQLGFPGVEHATANSLERAGLIANTYGYPVVVKPADRGKGIGISANVCTEQELETAFARARKVSSNAVLVEKKLPGEDHRVAVLGGKFAWAIQRNRARVVGDGTHTVAELIDRENAARRENIEQGFAKPLSSDQETLTALAQQDLSIGSTPEPGVMVNLRTIANVSTGGTYFDCSAGVHPDNRAMAEAVARAFQLDAIGIDFMTEDISVSWRDCTCGIIEVNATPAVSSDPRAEVVLGHKFPKGSDGRIPTIVLIGASTAAFEQVGNLLNPHRLRAGITDHATTRLEGIARCTHGDSLATRVRALLIDPDCEALIAATRIEDLENHGFPLDRCSLVLLCTGISHPLRELIEHCADQVITIADEDLSQPAVTDAITRLAEACKARTG